MSFVNYQQIVDDLVQLVQDSDIVFDYVADHMDDYERSLANVSYCNILLARSDPEIAASNVYTTRTTIELEIAALDLSSKREAVTMRNELVNEVQDLIRTNTNFSAELESVVLTQVDFEVFSRNSDEDQSFTATALIACEVIKYSE